MTIFRDGLIRDRYTRRPLAGMVVGVYDPGTSLAVPTVEQVVTDADGYYPQFETVDDIDHVELRVGDHRQHAVAVGAKLTDVGSTYTKAEVDQLLSSTSDTERRNILSTFTTTPSGGTVTLQRVGHTCLLNIVGLTFPASGSSTVAVIPNGFRPAETVATIMRGVSDVAQITTAGNLQIFSYTTARIDGSLMWISRDPWPTSLPGVPA